MTAATTNRAHGELDCVDAEAMLHDATMDNADLRARLTSQHEAIDAAERENDMLRIEADRLRALLDDVSQKNTSLVNERDGLAEQVKILNGELAAVEADAVPQGTLLFAAIARESMVSEYRRASRINRGPLPPSVIEAVENARETIIEAMTTAGNEALTAVIRREVRRRRRNQNRTSTSRR